MRDCHKETIKGAGKPEAWHAFVTRAMCVPGTINAAAAAVIADIVCLNTAFVSPGGGMSHVAPL
jgi:hypothetical protein